MSTTFNHKPSPDYLAAVAALAKLPPDDMGRAHADACADIAKQQWMEKHGVRQSSAFAGWRRVPVLECQTGKDVIRRAGFHSQ